MYEIGEYVYVFFREVAIEYINCGKASLPSTIIRFTRLKTQHHKKTLITENKTGLVRLCKLLWLHGDTMQ